MFQQPVLNFKPETKVWSVSDLNDNIKEILESHVGWIWLKGEISNLKCHSSGHWYFSLKDDKSQIRAVFFRHHAQKSKVNLTDGLEILAWGQLSVYTPRGEYQIYVQTIEPVGAGWLQQQFEMLKKKLSAEGLFDPSRKRTLPLRPKAIALVTSPTGAAIRDMLSILKRRAPSIPVILIPALVQGTEAPADLCRALEWAYQLKNIVDVIIVGRGGGSIEDLWAFNDENVVRKVAQSPIPIVSAVGHEVDVTLCDFAADVRAPTPSAAAEIVTLADQQILEKIQDLQKELLANWEFFIRQKWHAWEIQQTRLKNPSQKIQEWLQRLDEWIYRLQLSVRHQLSRHRSNWLNLTHQLKNPSARLQENQERLKGLRYRLDSSLNLILNNQKNRLSLLTQKVISFPLPLERLRAQLEAYTQRLNWSAKNSLNQQKNRLERLVSVLDQLSPLKIMSRGWSVAFNQNGQVIKTIKQVQENETIWLQLIDGALIQKIERITPERSLYEFLRKQDSKT